MATDATQELIDRFADPSAWDHVADGVPIFTEHTAYAILDDDGKPRRDKDGRPILEIVMPGKPAPKNSVLYYQIDAERVQRTADAINAALADHKTPIKLFLGHSDPRKPQTDQPPLVGYGVGATVAPWDGNGGRATIFSKLHYSKGQYEGARQYVQRSPEFYPTRDEITALALLKTDPRLPMGMMPYGKDGPVFYGRSFESYADTDGDGDDDSPHAKPAPKPDAKSDDASGDSDPTVNPGETGTPPDLDRDGDVDLDDAALADDLELTPDEAKTAMRYMSHYERHHPVIKYACDQYRSMQNKGHPAPDGNGNGATNMSKTTTAPAATAKNGAELPVQYQQLAERVTAAEVRYARADAKSRVDSLVFAGFKIKDPAKEIEHMAKLDDAGRAEREQEIRENYARTEQDPTRGPRIDVYAGSVESKKASGEDLTQKQVQEMVAYAAAKDLDLDDPDDLEKAIAKVSGKK